MSKLKVSVNAGHTKYGAGYGAVSGTYKESEINRLVATELIKLLRAKGHTVYDSTIDNAVSQTAYLNATVKKANSQKVDIFISIHCNAGGGQGVEVYTYKGAKHDNAVHVCYEISRLGFRNRGIKDGTKFAVVRNTTAKALLIELFFLDTPSDQTLYKKVGYKGLAKAIANAF